MSGYFAYKITSSLRDYEIRLKHSGCNPWYIYRSAMLKYLDENGKCS